MQQINALTRKVQRIAIQVVLAILTFICILAFSRCSLKRHVTTSSQTFDTSTFAHHTIDSSLFIDSSKYFTSVSKTEMIDTSNSNTIDEYERLMTQYYSKDPVTNLPVLDSSKTTEKGKKTTNEKNNKVSTQHAATTTAAINIYDQKSKAGDSSGQKSSTENKNKNAEAQIGIPFTTYAIVIVIIVIASFIAYRILKKATPVGIVEDTIKNI